MHLEFLLKVLSKILNSVRVIKERHLSFTNGKDLVASGGNEERDEP